MPQKTILGRECSFRRTSDSLYTGSTSFRRSSEWFQRLSDSFRRLSEWFQRLSESGTPGAKSFRRLSGWFRRSSEWFSPSPDSFRRSSEWFRRLSDRILHLWDSCTPLLGSFRQTSESSLPSPERCCGGSGRPFPSHAPACGGDAEAIAQASWSAAAERQGASLASATPLCAADRCDEAEERSSARESGVALRFPPQSKTLRGVRSPLWSAWITAFADPDTEALRQAYNALVNSLRR